MNSMISYSKLAAVALCGAVLVACNAVQDVSSAPTFPLPAQTVVVTGTVTGVPLSTTRPVVLEDDGQQRCAPPGSPATYTGPLIYCTYSVAGTAVMRFGSLPVGAPYNIKVTKQPFGRTCTLSNATGVANAAVSNIVLNCVRDGTPLHTVTANIAPAVANALPAGFKLTLTTEEGTETIVPTAGQTQVVFTKPVFDAGTSPPVFSYLVTATAELTPGVVSNCAVTGATNLAAAGTGAVSPTADVVTTVTACAFTISGAVTYNQPPQTVYTPQTITGLQLGLRYQATGAIVDTVVVPSFTPATAATTSPFTFPIARQNNSQGLYDVTVTTQPTSGQFCTVDGGGIAPLVVLPAWATSTANFPATQPANITGIAVRCRNIPAVANQLVGTYQVVGQNSTLTTVGTAPAPNTAVSTTMGTLNPGALGFGTTQATAISAANPAGTITTNTVSDDRRFLSFFSNGTFLYGVHTASANTTNGLEHGFYSYDSVAKTIYFTITTDNNGTTANSIASGLSGTPGQCAAVPAPVNFANGAVVSASDPAFSNLSFKSYLGIPAGNTAAGFATPFWINTGVGSNPPPATYSFNGKAVGTWTAPQLLGPTYWYQLLSITLTDPAGFSAPQVFTLPATCPTATAPVMTNVVKVAGTRGLLTGTFGSGTQGVVGTNREDWSLREPKQTPGQLEGVWVSANSKRVWIYSKAGFSPGFHMGVNGAANLQDACFAIQDATLASSFWSRRGGDVGCTPGGTAQLDANGNPIIASGAAVVVGGPAGTVDLPYTQTVPTATNSVLQTASSTAVLSSTILPGFRGRIPGSQSNQFVVPSPTNYVVAPGTPETLTVQETLNGALVGSPLTFTRQTIN